jgi:hypothetical protein
LEAAMMSAEECRAYSAIWLARGKKQNISFKRAMTFLDLARSWNLLAYEKDQLAAIEKEEEGIDPPQLAASSNRLRPFQL